MIKYIPRGDIFRIPGVTSYAHGCNCAGAMGKGIALQFKRKFHKMFNQYHALCVSGNFKSGDIFPCHQPPRLKASRLGCPETGRLKPGD